MGNGRNILITGASSGIGLGTTQGLVKRGYKVFAAARKPADLDRLKNEVGAEPVQLDVTQGEHIRALETFLEEHLKGEPLYAIINNSGIARHGPIECIPMAMLREQFEVNFFGLVAVMQVALPYIRKAKGRVINVSSILGRTAPPILGPYAASKFALEAVTDSMRRELCSSGVKVISINPGFIKTPMIEKEVDTLGLEKQFFTKEGQREVYLPQLQKMGNHVEKEKSKAGTVDMVFKAMIHALESSSPKTRYYVGKGISMAAAMNSHLPDKWMDKLMEKHLSS